MSTVTEVIQNLYESLKPKSYDFDQQSKPMRVLNLQEFTNRVVDQTGIPAQQINQHTLKSYHDFHVKVVTRYNELLEEYKDKEYQIKVARVEGKINEGRFGDKGYDTKTPHVFNYVYVNTDQQLFELILLMHKL